MSTYTPTPASPSLYPTQPSMKGFFATLFDFSFNSFLAPRLIKLLYILFVAIAALVTLGVIVTAYNFNNGLGVLVLLLSPVVFLFNVMLYRVGLELIQVFFAIEAHTAQQLALARTSTYPPVSPQTPRSY